MDTQYLAQDKKPGQGHPMSTLNHATAYKDASKL